MLRPGILHSRDPRHRSIAMMTSDAGTRLLHGSRRSRVARI